MSRSTWAAALASAIGLTACTGSEASRLEWTEQCQEDRLTGGTKDCIGLGRGTFGVWTTHCSIKAHRRDREVEIACMATSPATPAEDPSRGRAQAELSYRCSLDDWTERTRMLVIVTGPEHPLRDAWDGWYNMGLTHIGIIARSRAIGDEDSEPTDLGAATGTWWEKSRHPDGARIYIEADTKRHGALQRMVERSTRVRMEISIGTVMPERIFAIDATGAGEAIREAQETCSLTEAPGRGEKEPERKTSRTRPLQGAIAVVREAKRLEEERLALLEVNRTEYLGQIKDRIERNWLRPPGTASGLQCIARISQIPGGEVVQVEILTSSGNRIFDRSVEEAVFHASPLPVPKDPHR